MTVCSVSAGASAASVSVSVLDPASYDADETATASGSPPSSGPSGTVTE
ncbi:MAG: hypothetical protein OXU61_06700 [Gammaproteobacteria bacterium]|nr:hypothetical protein [Gammaproteobacteria bacterium]